MKETSVKNIIIGSGAAGYAAGIRLLQGGEKDTVLLTENRLSGTSRNTGSDKQTYYKLSLASADPDSVLTMAEDLFAGGCVDGDTALCEAALSVRGFFNLVELGVPFPCTEFGEYMGYKTDHDRGRRATSAGPYTSKMMTQVLEKRAEELGLSVADGMQAIRLLVKENHICGVLALNRKPAAESDRDLYCIYWTENVILATGGPAGIYHDSVYPESQIGSSGLAFEAGAAGKNLTEWQFGLASTKPRWNVSGTYMQVLPRFVSVDQNGCEREFLMEFFRTPEEMLSKVFLKGYQWPFDVSKIFGGSSIVDLLVYRETVLRGRKVFLDFMHNPCEGNFSFEKLEEEAYTYLKRADACFGTPYERLKQMNAPAIDFYLDHNVDLNREYLPVAVCAQHNNGGIAADAFWETDISGLYAVGECNGSHGVTRPGGSALNAGQVGAIRAADAVCRKKEYDFDRSAFREILRSEAELFVKKAGECNGERSLSELWVGASARMSAFGGMIRNKADLERAIEEAKNDLNNLQNLLRPVADTQLAEYYHLRDLLLTQIVYLSAMNDYAEHGGKSRGSALYTDPEGKKPDDTLPDLFACRLDLGEHSGEIQELRLTDDSAEEIHSIWRACRPIPDVDYFFENQWKKFRERNGNDLH